MFSGLCDRSNGRLTVESLAGLIGSGAWQMWTVWGDDRSHAWVLTSTYQAPSGIKVWRIEAIVGRKRWMWLHLMDEMIAAAKLNGCEIVECAARPGWRGDIPHLRHTNNFLEARI